MKLGILSSELIKNNNIQDLSEETKAIYYKAINTFGDNNVL